MTIWRSQSVFHYPSPPHLCEMTWCGPSHINLMTADVLAPNRRQVTSAIMLNWQLIVSQVSKYAAFVSRYSHKIYFGRERSGGIFNDTVCISGLAHAWNHKLQFPSWAKNNFLHSEKSRKNAHKSHLKSKISSAGSQSNICAFKSCIRVVLLSILCC